MPRIVVKPTAGGNKVTVTLENPSARITELKERLSTELSCPVEQQRLIYKGQILKDEKTLSDYGALSFSSISLSCGHAKTSMQAQRLGATARGIAVTFGGLGAGIEDDHVLHFVKARPPGSSG